MRPLYHPPVEDITVEGILYALSDPTRVQIVLQLMQVGCAQNCSAFLNIEKEPLPKSTLSQHFRVLREAGLIRSERKGVELQNSLRCDDTRERFGDLIRSILDAYVAQYTEQQKRPRAGE
jgi:DNA-binding transcriptional ArsR family regulator